MIRWAFTTTYPCAGFARARWNVRWKVRLEFRWNGRWNIRWEARQGRRTPFLRAIEPTETHQPRVHKLPRHATTYLPGNIQHTWQHTTYLATYNIPGNRQHTCSRWSGSSSAGRRSLARSGSAACSTGVATSATSGCSQEKRPPTMEARPALIDSDSGHTSIAYQYAVAGTSDVRWKPCHGIHSVMAYIVMIYIVMA